jgi:hypothetical protein
VKEGALREGFILQVEEVPFADDVTFVFRIRSGLRQMLLAVA